MTSEKITFDAPPMTCNDVVTADESNYDEVVGWLRTFLRFDDHLPLPIDNSIIERVEVGFYDDEDPDGIVLARGDSWWSTILLSMENLAIPERIEAGGWSMSSKPFNTAVVCVTTKSGRTVDVTVGFDVFFSMLVAMAPRGTAVGAARQVIESYLACESGHDNMEAFLPCFSVFLSKSEAVRYRCGCFTSLDAMEDFADEILAEDSAMTFGLRCVVDAERRFEAIGDGDAAKSYFESVRKVLS